MHVYWNLCCAFLGILPPCLFGYQPRVEQCVIEDFPAGVLEQRADVSSRREPNALVRFRHQVADEDFGCPRILDRVRDSAYQQIRNEGSEERTWPNGDHVCV